MVGLHTSVVALVLRLWIKASETSLPILRNKKAMLWLIDCSVCVCVLASVLYGGLWYKKWAQDAFGYIPVVIQSYCCLGFFIYGQNILLIFKRSRNRSPTGKQLPIKITVFLIVYDVIAAIGLVFVFLSPMGLVFSCFFAQLLDALMFYAIFLILFFPKMEKKRKRESTIITSPQVPMRKLSCLINSSDG